MPAYRKPWFSFNYQVSAEVDALREYRDHKPGRHIPTKSQDRLLVATWTIPNLGVHTRRHEDYLILAEMISWFDVVALQEVSGNLDGLRSIQKHLPDSYMALYSGTDSKNERLVFLYDAKKVRPLGEVGELTIPETDYQHIKLPGIKQQYRGFGRNPYFGAFISSSREFLLVNVHVYSRGDGVRDLERQSLEVYAILRWVDLRQKKDGRARHVIALGQFNLPKLESPNPILRVLRSRGLLHIPPHSTRMLSSFTFDEAFDHMMFLAHGTKDLLSQGPGVFDFDGALFQELWYTHTDKKFRSYVGYYISDHRILWAEFLTRPDSD